MAYNWTLIVAIKALSSLSSFSQVESICKSNQPNPEALYSLVPLKYSIAVATWPYRVLPSKGT